MKETLNRTSFTTAVLQMLDDGARVRTLNLRAVARTVGCAHTNAYNYVASWNELLWWSVAAALNVLIDSVDAEDADLLDAYITFGVTHPAWYQLIWMEPLRGEPPEAVRVALARPSHRFAQWLAARTGHLKVDDDALAMAARMLHGFMHGELSAWVAGRFGHPDGASPDAANAREQMNHGARALWNLIFKENYQ